MLAGVCALRDDADRHAAEPTTRVGGWPAGWPITAAALFGEPFTGGALNPARAFGPALASRHWTNHGVYWVGPLAGGVLAAWICDPV